MSDTTQETARRTIRSRPAGFWRLLRWTGVALGVLLLAIALVYARLLFGPISIDFVSDRAEAFVLDSLPADFALDLGGTTLSLDAGYAPVLRFAPVTLTQPEAGGAIAMAGLEVGFSPLWTLLGRPGAFVTLDQPRVQASLGLGRARLADLAFEPQAKGGAVVRVSRDRAQAPPVTIGPEGLRFPSGDAARGTLQSENQGLMQGFQTLNEALGDFARQADAGALSRIRVRDARIELHNTVYDLYRRFEGFGADIWSSGPRGHVEMRAQAEIGGRETTLSLSRSVTESGAQLEAALDNLDFATLMSALDDPGSVAALRGAGAMRADIAFARGTGAVKSGRFTLDLEGTRVRIAQDHFPLSMPPLNIDWDPEAAHFSFPETPIEIGRSRGRIAGDVALGFDPRFGPTLGLSLRAKDVALQPNDMAPQHAPFEEMALEGWTAPLYGAVGIDRLVVSREDASLFGHGRLDTVDGQTGIDFTLQGTGASADDLKRLWPYPFATEARQWVLDYLEAGHIESARMRIALPPGSSTEGGAIPEGGLRIDMVGRDVAMRPLEGVPAFALAGQARVRIRDNQLQVSMDRATIDDPSGHVTIANAAFINQDTAAPEQILEISGDVSGAVPSIASVMAREPLDLLSGIDLGVDIEAIAADLRGQTQATVIATIAMDAAGGMARTEYALNGTVRDLATREPIEGLSLAQGQLSFTASQAGFDISGSGAVQGAPVALEARQSGEGAPAVTLSSTLEIAQAREFGLDLSDYVSGAVQLVARPQPDGTVEIAADLTETGLTLSDIGMTKQAGQPGTLEAVVAPGASRIRVPSLSLRFGDVALAGSLDFETDGTLVGADFETFRISPGDDARVALAPNANGFDVTIRGEQLDIKPALRRFFDLANTGESGASAELEDQTFSLDVELARALGFFSTTAYNVDLDLAIQGDDVSRANLSAQLGQSASVSVTTNARGAGRTITYASNDVGGLLRFVGVYPRLVGGSATLVMRQPDGDQPETGQFVMSNFSVLGEENLNAVIGTHQASQRQLAGRAQVRFDQARASFVRHSDMIEVEEIALYGDTVGGTLRGNIFTQAGRYDLAGTYVPLFGINNAFAQIPVFGRFFGGRDGEGLLGVTFAVRGPLDQPDVLINPVSILAPGAFRSLFEYRAAQNGGTR